MSRDKQIEEMAKDVDEVMQSRCFHKSCNECEFDCYAACKATMLADALVNDYGYRKSSEVAREIIEEIDSMIYKVLNDRHYIMGDMCYEVAELKKKYTEGEG